MSREPFFHVAFVGLVGLVLVQFAGLLRADAQAEFGQLMDQAQKRYDDDKYSEMENTALRLCGLAEGSLKDQPAYLPDALFQLARAYEMKGQYAKAVQTYHRTLTLDEKVYGIDSQAVANVLSNLGQVYGKLCRYSEADRRRHSAK